MSDAKSSENNELLHIDMAEGTDEKRVRKPTIKVIENQIQQSRLHLEAEWKKVKASIDNLKQAPDLVEKIRQEVSNSRLAFSAYENAHHNLIDFIASSNHPELQDELKVVENLMRNRKEFVNSAIIDATARKNDILQEVNSNRSYSSSCVSSSRSSQSHRSLLHVQAKADAAAAKKRAEISAKISQFEKEGEEKIGRLEKALKDQQDALFKVKKEEEKRIQNLRLNEELEVARARLEAIENEEYSGEERKDFKSIKLPEVNSKERVLNFIDSLPCEEVIQGHPTEARGCGLPVGQESRNGKEREDSLSERKMIESCMRFMARREVIANKVEKFDDAPQNFRTWKVSFKNMIKDVSVNSSEELSLMLEYTTGESKKLVQRLRNAYIENPEEGVKEAWKRLTERFGSDAIITKVQMDKLNTFPKIGAKENKKLQDFGDLLLELECAKQAGGFRGLNVLDEPTYLRPIIEKLPDDLQGRWQTKAYRYKVEHQVHYPPFSVLAEFVQEVAKERNDPYLAIDKVEKPRITSKPNDSFAPLTRRGVTTMKTEVPTDTPEQPSQWCCLHKRPHPLTKCRLFLSKSLGEKRKILNQERICWRCASSRQHIARECQETIYCEECHSDSHITAFHPQPAESAATSQEDEIQSQVNIKTSCTEVCREEKGSKSCCKMCPAFVYNISNPHKKIKVYVVIDDQSNRSLAKAKLFNELGEIGEQTPYSLTTCTGVSEQKGRRASGWVVESMHGNVKYTLPTITECDAIPGSKDEIPTPGAALAHPHLKDIASKIPPLDPTTEVLLLIGRDAPDLHKVRESRNGPMNAPWAQRLDLGWVVIGNTCLDGAHVPDNISSCATYVLSNGRPSHLQPCPNQLHLKLTSPSTTSSRSTDQERGMFLDGKFTDGLGKNIYTTTKDDNKVGLSLEDRKFVSTMERGMTKGEDGNWVAPLPFRDTIGDLPNSRDLAMKRLKSTMRNMDKKPQMKEHYFKFMQNLLDNEIAEIVPSDEVNTPKPCWFLPHFGVYHPQKLNKVRVVYDAAAENKGISLNSMLLSGPDLTNNLLGILLRFREDTVAFMADIEQMFYSFLVQADHRDFLRFLWFKDNNPDGQIVEYRMKVHIFGSTSSPAIATYGLRKTAEVEGAKYGQDAVELVNKNFYVDDVLKAVATEEEAVDLLQRTQAMLATAKLRLHKIASNSGAVMEAFPSEDQATNLRNLDFSKDTVPTQRSLGVAWDLTGDTFTFHVTTDEKPFTRRGVLSVVNSLYDPLGLVAPVSIKGKALLRGMTASLQPNNWDDPLPEESRKPWEAWKTSLESLNNVKVPRSYCTRSLSAATRKEIHTFGDASNEAIAAVSYLRIVWPDGAIDVAFILGKAKLAPIRATTIPRLELCAALLATEITVFITDEIDFVPDAVFYYTDSRVVLGYICNEKRRFYVYVSNRIAEIRNHSDATQWRYVPSSLNPADVATRSTNASNLQSTSWHNGPEFLYKADLTTLVEGCSPETEILQDDPEVRTTIKVAATKIDKEDNLGTERFTRFSEWLTLLGGLSRLVEAARSRRKEETSRKEALQKAELVLLRNIQRKAYGEELKCLRSGSTLPKNSPLRELNPVINEDGLVAVGGRLEDSDLSERERHPIILPGSDYTVGLLVKYLHAKIQHQGRQFTLGTIRSHGFWIIGVRRLVNSTISRCLKCKKQREPLQQQLMANLPRERVVPAPPFTYVGVDVFGPWEVVARRTRGGLAHSKRWAVMFTCLSTRAIHIEVIESMDTSSFINSLRRFLAMRGPVVQLRSDCGTNFVGANNEFGKEGNRVNLREVEGYLAQENCEWVFNPPHASHAGGVWERMIGVVRRVLDAVWNPTVKKHLTHEVLTTLMAEASAIVNGRPLAPVSSDPTSPEVLTPATILTLKPRTLKAPPGKFDSECLTGKQWRIVQQLANSFWAKWRREYLHLLQIRKKWSHEMPNLKVGDLVLLQNKETPRNCWPMARITEVATSKDGRVRQVEVMTALNGVKKTYRRPVTDLVLLSRN